MRTKILIVLILLFCGYTASIAWSAPPPPRDCPNCWKNFLKMNDYRVLTIKPMARARTFSINMRGLKSALQKAGINERISIQMVYKNKLLADLGSFSPMMKQMRGSRSFVPSFKSMPAARAIALPNTFKSFPTSGKHPALLIFKNAGGQIKGKVNIQFNINSNLL